MGKPFVHLHLHTQYSMLDGATRIEQLFSRCSELSMPAVAITDHGNMYGAFEFVKQAVKFTDSDADVFEFLEKRREFKVKPIIGCEFYMTEDMSVKQSIGGKMPKYNHLILLAKDVMGYKNLIKLVSLSFTEGLYYKPRIDFKLLKKHTEGLVCLSACIAGVIPQAILRGEIEKADEYVKTFKQLFKDDFYIEIQDHNIKDQKVVLPGLIKLANANNVKIVATNDVHYMRKSDSTMQKVLQCISFRSTMSASELDEDTSDNQAEISEDSYFPTKEFYLKSYEEMDELFPNIPDCLSNTLEVMEKCSPYFFVKEPLLPSYVTSDGSEPYQFLHNLTYEGLNKKYPVITPEIKARADYELGIIHRLGFVDYFLIVWDFIYFSEANDIPVGPGRGSGVGSIVAYAVGITKVDPLKYGLIFERFLNAERVSNPDFDIDFCVDRREDVIKYVISKYGESNVSQIVTFGTLAAKAAVKDVGRVFNQPYSEVEKITKLIPTMMGKNHIGHLLGLIQPKEGQPSPVIQELKNMYEEDATAKSILDMAMKIEGMPRQTGMHAAGVIICRDPISDHVPMSMSSDGIVTTEFNMIECEELGLLKMDFLGLRTLTDIKKSVDIVKKTKGITLDFYNMSYDDEGVFKLIGEGDTHAVFQLESEGMKKFMRDLKPSSLEDIIAGISLYRPGPMDKIDDYVFNKKNPDKIKYDDELLRPILDMTYGVMVYQEQVMKIVQVLGGYSLGRADNVRRMMSKKKKDAMEKERAVFVHGTVDKGVVIKGCIGNGVSEAAANKIYDDMISFASYAFNKSHAAAYAFLAYQTAYLKCYHTVEFVTAVLNNRITSIDEIRNYLSYLKERGFSVLPPSINKSSMEFTVEEGAVRIGMAAIKNVGSSVIGEIVAEREKNGEFTDFVQFVKRMENTTLNKKMLESLIFSGTFDCFNRPRAQLIAVYESVLDRVSKDKQAKVRGQFSFFDNDDSELDTFVYPDIKEYDLATKLGREKEVAGVYLTGHPLDEYVEYLKGYTVNSSMLRPSEAESEEEYADNYDGKSVTLGGMLVEATKKITKTNKELGIGKLEDLYGTVELVVSPYKMNVLKREWEKDKLVSVTGKVNNKDGNISIWVDKIEEWQSVQKEKTTFKKICFYISFKNDSPNIMDKINELIAVYPGKDEVYIKNVDENTLFAVDSKVRICSLMLNEAYGLVSEDKIKILG